MKRPPGKGSNIWELPVAGRKLMCCMAFPLDVPELRFLRPVPRTAPPMLLSPHRFAKPTRNQGRELPSLSRIVTRISSQATMSHMRIRSPRRAGSSGPANRRQRLGHSRSGLRLSLQFNTRWKPPLPDRPRGLQPRILTQAEAHKPVAKDTGIGPACRPGSAIGVTTRWRPW